MPSTANLIGFTLLALVIILVPGPSVIFAIGRALILGTKAAVTSVFGNALGVGVQIVIVALGLGALIQQFDQLFIAVKLFGAGMIAYLGIKAFISRGDLDLSAEGQPESGKSVFRQSVLVGLTNAKTFVFFIAALPTFASPELGNPTIQMLFMGVIFTVIGVSSDSVYAVAAGTARKWLASSHKRISAFRGAGGIALTLLGLYMLWDALAH